MRRFLVEDSAPSTRPLSGGDLRLFSLLALSTAHLDDETEGRHRVQNTFPHSPQVRFLEMKENLVPHMSHVKAEGELFSLSELL